MRGRPMLAAKFDEITDGYAHSDVVAEGKTKIIYGAKDKPHLAIIHAKDDLTAGNGKKREQFRNKGQYATTTTVNVFRLLQACGVPVAFTEQLAPAAFVAPMCRMLPYEVVMRREAHGSYLKRNPHIKKGHLFPKLLVELYLKTTGRKWKEYDLPCDDPYMEFHAESNEIELYDPALPLQSQIAFLVLAAGNVFTETHEASLLDRMGQLGRRVFLILEKAWQLQNKKLVDLKIEFGIDAEGNLLVADVIDNDSWRLLADGAYIDKQVFRDDGSLAQVIINYRNVADFSKRFAIPNQRIIIWRGSEKDNVLPVSDALGEFLAYAKMVTCSMHKKPETGIELFRSLEHEIPDSVVLACVGRSNGAGPILSALGTVPVITVPTTVKEFPDDVWSSLRAPSQTPVMTVLESENAALAALQILSARNPHIYAHLRSQIEERMK